MDGPIQRAIRGRDLPNPSSGVGALPYLARKIQYEDRLKYDTLYGCTESEAYGVWIIKTGG